MLNTAYLAQECSSPWRQDAAILPGSPGLHFPGAQNRSEPVPASPQLWPSAVMNNLFILGSGSHPSRCLAGRGLSGCGAGKGLGGLVTALPLPKSPVLEAAAGCSVLKFTRAFSESQRLQHTTGIQQVETRDARQVEMHRNALHKKDFPVCPTGHPDTLEGTR